MGHSRDDSDEAGQGKGQENDESEDLGVDNSIQMIREASNSFSSSDARKIQKCFQQREANGNGDDTAKFSQSADLVEAGIAQEGLKPATDHESSVKIGLETSSKSKALRRSNILAISDKGSSSESLNSVKILSK